MLLSKLKSLLHHMQKSKHGFGNFESEVAKIEHSDKYRTKLKVLNDLKHLNGISNQMLRKWRRQLDFSDYNKYIKQSIKNRTIVSSTYPAKLVKLYISNMKRHAINQNHVYYYTTKMKYHTKVTTPHYLSKSQQQKLQRLQKYMQSLESNDDGQAITVDSLAYNDAVSYYLHFNDMFNIKSAHIYINNFKLNPQKLTKSQLYGHLYIELKHMLKEH